MSITVRKRADWLTPFEVEVVVGQGHPTTARFAAASKAQQYALAQADRTGEPLVYDVDDSGVPMNSGNSETSKGRTVTQAEFQARYKQICAKCRQAKPLAEFGHVYHQNRTTGRRVFHGYQPKCAACEEAS